ncbi:hypothetical protein J4463_02840 [Candidatus Pacearchaeota archaeon]|nr:hypothetical protein [Candidatus Pacearchaeota archaeon]
MITSINLIAGIGVIVLNLIPLVLKKPRYLLLTSLLSLLIALSLIFFE